jgi:hypothetical protein
MSQTHPFPASDKLMSLAFSSLDYGVENVRDLEPSGAGAAFTPFMEVLSKGKKKLIRLFADTEEQALEMAVGIINDPAHAVEAYAIAFDGRVTLDGQKRDCVLVEACERGQPHGITLAQRYLKQGPESFETLGNPTLISQPTSRFTGDASGPVSVAATPGVDERFSPEEWKVLRMAPIHVFLLVAGADGKLDEKEAEAFEKLLLHSEAHIQDPLLRRITAGFTEESAAQAVMDAAGQGESAALELFTIPGMLKGKLGEEEATRFKTALLQFGKVIAESSGGFFGFGSRISKDERKTLEGLARVFNVKLDL